MEDLFTLALTLDKPLFAERCPYPLLLAVNELAPVPIGGPGDDVTTHSAFGAKPPATQPVSGRPALYAVRKVQTLVPHAIIVGRAATSDIVIPDGHISKAHALIQAVGGSWQVSDMGSRNGTHVNNTRVEPRGAAVPIKFGDLINFAYRVYYFLDANGVWEELRG